MPLTLVHTELYEVLNKTEPWPMIRFLDDSSGAQARWGLNTSPQHAHTNYLTIGAGLDQAKKSPLWIL